MGCGGVRGEEEPGLLRGDGGGTCSTEETIRLMKPVLRLILERSYVAKGPVTIVMVLENIDFVQIKLLLPDQCSDEGSVVSSGRGSAGSCSLCCRGA